MTTKLGSDPAFPVALDDFRDFEHHPALGLTKREYFAAIAMQGIVASSVTTEAYTISAMARDSVRLADALLAALENEDD